MIATLEVALFLIQISIKLFLSSRWWVAQIPADILGFVWPPRRLGSLDGEGGAEALHTSASICLTHHLLPERGLNSLAERCHARWKTLFKQRRIIGIQACGKTFTQSLASHPQNISL